MDADGGGGSGVRLLRFEICDCDARDDGRGDGEGGCRLPPPPPWRPTPRLLPVGVIRQFLKEDYHQDMNLIIRVWGDQLMNVISSYLDKVSY